MSKISPLYIKKIEAQVDGKAILQGVNWKLNPGKSYMLIGANGAGKSTLAQVLAGNPQYQINKGVIQWGPTNMLDLSPEARALKGLFVSFQSPLPLPVQMVQFLKVTLEKLREARSEKSMGMAHLLQTIKEKMKWVGLPESMLYRPLYENASGGEKKRGELLQVILRLPDLTVLDEIDSGMDIDGLPLIGEVVDWLRKQGKIVLLISHNPYLLKHVHIDEIAWLKAGKIQEKGDKKLLEKISSKGYLNTTLTGQ